MCPIRVPRAPNLPAKVRFEDDTAGVTLVRVVGDHRENRRKSEHERGQEERCARDNDQDVIASEGRGSAIAGVFFIVESSRFLH
jgi:hypothetical protein